MQSATGTADRALVDAIVREVLARLAAGARSTSPASSGEPSLVAGSPAGPRELAIASRLVTAAALNGRLDGVRRLRVTRGAVVTPAVRDLLRERKIELAVDPTPPAKHGSARFVLAVAGVRWDAAQLLELLAGRGWSVQALAEQELVAAAQALGREVAAGAAGMLLTDHPAVGACVANRRRGVRAAVVSSAADVRGVVAALGANLLVTDPARLAAGELERLTGELGGCVPTCPSVLADVLR